MGNKKTCAFTLDSDVAMKTSMASGNGENMSGVVNNFLRTYLEIDNSRTPYNILKEELHNITIERNKLNEEIALKEAELQKYDEEHKKDQQQKLRDIINANKALQASGILRRIG